MDKKRRIGEGRTVLRDEYCGGKYCVSTINIAAAHDGMKQTQEDYKSWFDAYGGVIYETIVFDDSRGFGTNRVLFQLRAPKSIGQSRITIRVLNS